MANLLRNVVLAAALILLTIKATPAAGGCTGLRRSRNWPIIFYYYYGTFYSCRVQVEGVILGCNGVCSSKVEAQPQVADANGAFSSHPPISCSSDTAASCCKSSYSTYITLADLAESNYVYNFQQHPVLDSSEFHTYTTQQMRCWHYYSEVELQDNDPLLWYIRYQFLLKVPASCQCEPCEKVACTITT